GVDPSSAAQPSRWCVRPFARRSGQDLQHGEDGVPQVLRTAAPPRQELPQEEVRTHEPAPPQEEAEISLFFSFCHGCLVMSHHVALVLSLSLFCRRPFETCFRYL
ncbi:unnamed protein product, partial [Ectocarpus fasciculatus]